MNVTDEQGRQWIAVEHGPRVQANDGAANHTLERSIIIPLNGTQTRCYLGAYWNETRVDFKHGDTWWHITQCDQPRDREGRKPNFYPIVETMINANS